MPPTPVPDPVQAAMALLAAGKHTQAEAAARRILQRQPSLPAANQALALILAESGRPDQALYYIGRATAAAPADANLHHTLAALRARAGDQASSEAALRRALELDHDHLESLVSLGTLMRARNLLGQADPFLARAHELAPHRFDALSNLTDIRAESDPAAAIALIDRAMLRGLNELSVAGVACFICGYTETDPAAVAERHRRLGRLLARAAPPGPNRARSAPRTPEPGRPLRIGFLSPDLRNHAVVRFLHPALRHLDPARFQTVCYHTHPDSDDDTERVRRAAALFRHIPALSDDDLLRLIAADQIDILVDLAGHTDGNRRTLLARRAAPVQVNWIGYPASTGIPNLDFRIVDEITDPSSDPCPGPQPLPGDFAQSFATERLVRLPRCFLCYSPSPEAPPAQPRPPGHHPVVFGSFNKAAKISGPTVELWSALLRAVPGSRLLLKAKALGDPAVRERLAARFAAAGLEPDRLEMLPITVSIPDHLASYNRVDIALDTFPYNGTTTTCEALHMGVPVVTLAGRTHASRVGASLLTAAGLPELVAHTPERFIAAAAALAGDRAGLAALSAGLRNRLLASDLCNGPAHAAALGAAFLRMWGVPAPV
jgi:protein O-GlcNAc transferase